MNKFYLFLLALFASLGLSAQTYVNIPFNGNNYDNNGVQPTDNVTTHTLKIGTGDFYVKVWDGSADHLYYNIGQIEQNKDVTLTEQTPNSENDARGKMTIKGATANQEFVITFNVNTHVINVSPVGGGSTTPEYSMTIGTKTVTNLRAWMKIGNDEEKAFSNKISDNIFRTETITYAPGHKLYGYRYGSGNAWFGNNPSEMTANTTISLSAANGNQSEGGNQNITLTTGQKYYLELNVSNRTVTLKLESVAGVPDYLYIHIGHGTGSNAWSGTPVQQKSNSTTEWQNYTYTATGNGTDYFVFSTNNELPWNSNKANSYAPSGYSQITLKKTNPATETTYSTIDKNTGTAAFYYTVKKGYKYTISAHYASGYGSVWYRVFEETPSDDTEGWYYTVTEGYNANHNAPEGEYLPVDNNTFTVTLNDGDLVKLYLKSGNSYKSYCWDSDGHYWIWTTKDARELNEADHGWLFHNERNEAGGQYTFNLYPQVDGSYTASVTENVVGVPDARYTVDDAGGTSKYYYFSGDMNTWSDVCTKNNPLRYGANGPVDFKGETLDKYWDYTQDPGVPYRQFQSLEDMNSKWRFRQAKSAELTRAGLSGDEWLYLDLRNNEDFFGHKGVLCGQFKIIRGCLTTDTENFANATIPLNTLTTLIKGAGANAKLADTSFAKAEIFFNPTTKQIKILGEPRPKYFYYVHVGHEDDMLAPTKTEISSGGQVNYPSVAEDYNLGTGVYAPGGEYGWEKVTDPVNYYDAEGELIKTFTKGVWRRKIHPTFADRSPMAFKMKLTSYNNTTFEMRALSCEDEWFIEGSDVHVYVRFDNTTDRYDSNKPLFTRGMYFNAYTNEYEIDNDGHQITTQRFLFDHYEPMLPNMNANPDTDPEADQGAIGDQGQYVSAHQWFRTADPVAFKWATTGYALLATTNDERFPVGGINAPLEDRNKVEMVGTDLYIVIPSKTDLHILYSHLNGSYNLNDKSKNGGNIQIHAELFHRDEDPIYVKHELDTSLGNGVKYRFRVYRGETELANSGLQDLPFYSWDVQDLDVGNYQIVVTATRNGKTYRSYDVYEIAGNNSAIVGPEAQE